MNSHEEIIRNISSNQIKIANLENEIDKNDSKYNVIEKLCRTSALVSCAAMGLVLVSPFSSSVSSLASFGALGVIATSYFVSLISCTKLDTKKHELLGKISELESENNRLNDESKELYIIEKNKEINNIIEEKDIPQQYNDNKVKVLSLTRTKNNK